MLKYILMASALLVVPVKSFAATSYTVDQLASMCRSIGPEAFFKRTYLSEDFGYSYECVIDTPSDSEFSKIEPSFLHLPEKGDPPGRYELSDIMGSYLRGNTLSAIRAHKVTRNISSSRASKAMGKTWPFDTVEIIGEVDDFGIAKSKVYPK